MDLELPVDGDVLVVDDDAFVGNMVVRQIQRIGRACYLVDSYQSALEKLADTPNIGLVILDHGVEPRDLPRFVAKVQNEGLATTLVGSSGSDCREEFASLGVERFLLKPWSMPQLCDELQHPGATAPANASLVSSPGFTVGERCRAIGAELAGLQGTIESELASGRLTVRLEGSRLAGVLLEIDAGAVERVK